MKYEKPYLDIVPLDGEIVFTSLKITTEGDNSEIEIPDL